jgi:tRNA pseudouridine55 synthase
MANLASIAMLAELDGILLVDKPAGISAHEVMKAVKTRFNLVKVGHGGTLDVTASGLFVLLLGNATRFSNALMNGDRSYKVSIRLGRETDTSDHAGHLLSEKPFADVTREALDATLKDFRGDIYQAPPAFSAVKIPGREGYEIIQTPEEEAARERMVHVYRFAVMEFAPPIVKAEISCTKGASVRSLVGGFGRALGCGAVLEDCRRVAAGRHKIEGALPFMDILKLDAVDFKGRVIPMPEAGLR